MTYKHLRNTQKDLTLFYLPIIFYSVFILFGFEEVCTVCSQIPLSSLGQLNIWDNRADFMSMLPCNLNIMFKETIAQPSGQIVVKRR